ncbi:AAA domain-containing protein [Phycomyces nitens]|nr:AAA domain-containing protein [Phycomyces nitens]
MFVDVGGQEHKNTRTNSFWNDAEMALSANIIESLLSRGISSSDIGVIALYKQQADALSHHISERLENNTKNIHISTVDSFQGGEKEIIILSTVRTSSSGFIDNHPRVNVAISRAKRHLIILGSKSLMMMNELWSNVLWECQGESVKFLFGNITRI